MKHSFRFLSIKGWLAMAAVVVVGACGTTSTVPITGRKQSLIVSSEQVMSLSNEQYASYMKTAKPSTNAANTQMVQRVGQRLADAVITYLTNNGYADDAKTYQWAFNLVQDAQVNAFCMPGGKIVVYEGLLPVTQDETSLAIVLGHEIAHAVAKHSMEQMSNAMKQQYGAQIFGAVLTGAGASANMKAISEQVFGLGTQFGAAAYSRKHESEADHLGLIFAAMAGYDPAAAVPFWQRMAASSNGASYSLLSTHPSDAKRVTDIQKWLPEAQKYYTPAKAKTTTTTAKSSTKSVSASSLMKKK